MVKIRKNLSDEDMLKGYEEKITFEHTSGQDKAAPADPVSAFFTPELQREVGRALLALKVELYKQGIVDYKFKVAHKDNQVILTAVPVKKSRR